MPFDPAFLVFFHTLTSQTQISPGCIIMCLYIIGKRIPRCYCPDPAALTAQRLMEPDASHPEQQPPANPPKVSASCGRGPLPAYKNGDPSEQIPDRNADPKSFFGSGRSITFPSISLR